MVSIPYFYCFVKCFCRLLLRQSKQRVHAPFFVIFILFDRRLSLFCRSTRPAAHTRRRTGRAAAATRLQAAYKKGVTKNARSAQKMGATRVLL